jgi:hypothetical protein
MRNIWPTDALPTILGCSTVVVLLSGPRSLTPILIGCFATTLAALATLATITRRKVVPRAVFIVNMLWVLAPLGFFFWLTSRLSFHFSG